MLVLSRKPEESIKITTPSGEEITIVVVEIRGDKVRLGCEAVREIEIHRSEVYHAIQREKQKQLNQSEPEKPEQPAA